MRKRGHAGAKEREGEPRGPSARATKESIPHCLGETPIFLLYPTSVSPESVCTCSRTVARADDGHTGAHAARSDGRPGKFGTHRCIFISLRAAPGASQGQVRELWPIYERPRRKLSREFATSLQARKNVVSDPSRVTGDRKREHVELKIHFCPVSSLGLPASFLLIFYSFIYSINETRHLRKYLCT